MVSIGKQYEKPQYYLKDPVFNVKDGVFFGGLHEKIGFTDEMNAKTLRALQKGQDAQGNQIVPLGPDGKHSSGKDITFSMDKSFSLLYAAGDENMKTAIKETAVETHQEILKQMVKDGKIGDREHVRENGVDKMVFHAITDPDKLSVYSFIQSLSREGQWDIHVHGSFFNIGLDENGKVRALTFDPAMEPGYRQYLDSLGKNISIQKMTEKTGKDFTKITNTDRNTGIITLNNVSDETIKANSLRREQIKGYVSEHGGDTQNANLRTRKAKNTDITKEELFSQIEPYKDEINTFKSADPPNQEKDIKTTIKETIEAQSEREVFTNDFKLYNEVLKENRNFKLDDVNSAVQELKKDGYLIERQVESVKSKYENVNLTQYATSELVKIEKDFRQTVIDGKGKSDIQIDDDTLINSIKSVEKIKSGQLKKTFEYSSEQVNLIHSIFSSKDKFVAVQGDAGTGKTTAYEAIKKIADMNNINVVGFAQAGSQAATLQVDSGIGSQTIQHFITKIQGKIESGEKIEKITQKTLIALDEASLVGVKDLYQFTQTLDIQYENWKLAGVGDNKQILSQAAGLGFDVILKSGTDKAILTDIKRIQNKELKKIVYDYYKQIKNENVKINGQKIFDKLKDAGFIDIVGGGNADGKLIDKIEINFNEIAKEIAEYSKSGEETLAITATNKSKDIIDAGTREELKSAGLLDKKDITLENYRKVNMDDVAKLRAESFQKGDIISLKKNEKSIVTGSNRVNDTILVKDIKYITSDEFAKKGGVINARKGFIELGGKRYDLAGFNPDKTIISFHGKEQTVNLRDKKATKQLQKFKPGDIKIARGDKLVFTDNQKITTDKDILKSISLVTFNENTGKPEFKQITEKEYKKLKSDAKLKRFGNRALKATQEILDPDKRFLPKKNIHTEWDIKYQINRDKIIKTFDKKGNLQIKESIGTKGDGTVIFVKQYEKQKIELKNKEEIQVIKVDEKKGLYTFKSKLNGEITLDANKIDNYKALQGLLHNYARTAADAQGLSKDKGVLAQDGRMDANRLLVGLTRFRQDIKIKVNDVKAFIEDLSARQTKTSSLSGPVREKENPEITQEKIAKKQTKTQKQQQAQETVDRGLSM
jgi:conjugative relaxase-like TrwC/TraI family protein